MLKAIIENGAIVPLGPLPNQWADGTEVTVEAVDGYAMTPDEIDRSFDELERLCATADPDDGERMDAAIREADRLAKNQVRREMGLPE